MTFNNLLNISDLNQGTIMMNFAAILLLAVIMVHTNMFRKRGFLTDKLFFALIIIDMVIAVTDSINYTLYFSSFNLADEVINVSDHLFCLAVELFMMFFLFYLASIKSEGENLKRKFILYSIPMIIETICIIVNIFTKFMLYIDENNNYVETKYYVIIYLGVAVYGFLAAFELYRISKGLLVVLIAVVLIVPLWIVLTPDISSTAFYYGIILTYSHICMMNMEFYGEVTK